MKLNKIKYLIKEFVIENGNYEISWLDTNVAPDMNVKRTLMLPDTNSVIESWNNFEIITRGGVGQWVLQTRGNGDAMVWFTDAEKEKNSRNLRDFAIILISLGFSLMIGIFFEKEKNNKSRAKEVTRTVMMVNSCLIVAGGIFLVFEKIKLGSFFLILAIIGIIVWFFSRLEDNQLPNA